MNVSGNKKALFSMHGVTEANKCLQALEKLADVHDFDIDTLNNISETGGVYVKANGTILEYFDKSAEESAKYKLVPTGLKFRYSEYPLFAAFIKLHGQWEGCFVGTGTMLFDMYKDHYDGEFNLDYQDVFGGENRVRDLIGFGLLEILDNDTNESKEETVYSSEDSISNQLEVALNKLKNKIEKSGTTSSSKNSRTKHKNKAQRKAEKLQKHLERVKEKERQQKEKEDEIKRQQEEQKRLADELARTEHGVVWAQVIPMEEVHFYFEDNETKEFNKRVEQYINSNETQETIEKEITEEEKTTTLADVIIDVVNDIVTKDAVIENTNNHIEDCDEQDIISDLDHDNYVKTESEKYRMQIKNDIINDIYERLLIKENWKFNSKNRLGFYLRGICLFVWREQKNNPELIRGNGYTFSNDMKYCIINTGLMDTYGNFIYLIDHSPSVPDFYTKVVSIMYNKAALLKLNFDINNVKYLPSPIKFVNNNNELIFDAEYDDFDLDDTSHLFHIINERIGRFPDKYAKESPLVICERIKSAIRQAILISHTDYKYVVPKYDFSRKQIQFLIPLYLDNTLDTSPELTIVVGKQANEIWSIYTVLYSDDAYDDARLISRASDSWLNMKKRGGI